MFGGSCICVSRVIGVGFFYPHFASNSNSVYIEPFWQVNDVVVTSNDTLVSCSSDTTLKVYSLACRISAALLSFG